MIEQSHQPAAASRPGYGLVPRRRPRERRFDHRRADELASYTRGFAYDESGFPLPARRLSLTARMMRLLER